MTPPLTDSPPRIWLETEETVRARLLAAMPPQYSTVEGAWARDMLELDVLEFTRLWSELNQYLAFTFIHWATGPQLDAHGEQYGVPRKTGTQATGSVRFIAPENTPIAPATLVSVPSDDPDEERAVYQTANLSSVVVPAAGYIDVPIIAINIGRAGNKGPGAITLLDSPNVEGIEEIKNLGSVTGGSDPEVDEEYRIRLEAAAALPTGSGTMLDYVTWSLEKPAVTDVAVQKLWDTAGTTPGVFDGRQNGSVLVSLRGPSFVGVDWADLEEVQKYLDPSRQLIAIFENGEPWTLKEGAGSIAWASTDVQAGASSLVITATGSQTNVVSLTREMDLSRFAAADTFYFWLKAADWSKVVNTSTVRFYTTDTDYYEAPLSATTLGEPAKPTTGNAWWRWRVDKSSAAATGKPDWSAIARVEIRQTTNAATSCTWDYFKIASNTGSTDEGKAPVGAAVTVVTPVPKSIDVTAKVTPEPGYSLSGAPGTTDLTTLIHDAIAEYMRTLKPGEPVRTARIANAINDTPGVEDFVLRAPGATTTLSEAATLPKAEIKVKSAAAFLSKGTAFVNDQPIAYTGKTSTALTGCTGGAGVQADGSVVIQNDIEVTMSEYAVLGVLTLT